MTTAASLDFLALRGGVRFFRGSSLWGGKEGMVDQIFRTFFRTLLGVF